MRVARICPTPAGSISRTTRRTRWRSWHYGAPDNARTIATSSFRHWRTPSVWPQRKGGLAKAQERRNLAEYEGHTERDDGLLAELIATANELRRTVALPHGSSAK